MFNEILVIGSSFVLCQLLNKVIDSLPLRIRTAAAPWVLPVALAMNVSIWKMTAAGFGAGIASVYPIQLLLIFTVCVLVLRAPKIIHDWLRDSPARIWLFIGKGLLLGTIAAMIGIIVVGQIIGQFYWEGVFKHSTGPVAYTLGAFAGMNPDLAVLLSLVTGTCGAIGASLLRRRVPEENYGVYLGMTSHVAGIVAAGLESRIQRDQAEVGLMIGVISGGFALPLVMLGDFIVR